MSRILYMTDKYRVSRGYEPHFTRILRRAQIKRQQVIIADVYNLVDSPLRKARVTDTVWRFNPDKLGEIRSAFERRVNVLKPSLIVVSCPAVLGLFAPDFSSATLEKMRGGVYDWNGIPVIITLPITAVNQRMDTVAVTNEDGESDTVAPYKLPMGEQLIIWDWQKIGRFFHGVQRKHPKFTYSVCRTLEDCRAAYEYLRECIAIGTDIETGCWPPQVTCCGFAGLLPSGAVHTFVIPFYDEFANDGLFWADEFEHLAAFRIYEDILDLPVPKIYHNGAYDCTYHVRDRTPPRNYFLDTMLGWWSSFMEMKKKLNLVSSVVLDNYQYWKDDIKGDDVEKIGRAPNSERYWRYNALDCYNTVLNAVYVFRIVASQDRLKLNYVRAYRRMLSGFQMSMRGVKADFDRREEHREALTAERDEAMARFRFMIADSEFNVNSPQQKASLMYDVLGVTPRSDRGRAIGKDSKLKPSSGAIPIKLGKADHPFFNIVLSAMESVMAPDKQISNVCDVKLYSDRFRTAFNATGTETMRYSSKKSNLWDGTNIQNIRKDYRDWMVADPGHILLDIDFSQSDDVFVGYESQDLDKIEVVESGRDGHAVNGAMFFKRSYESIVHGHKMKDPEIVHPTKGIRQIAKRVVHGTNFQMAAFTLYVTMGREQVIAAAILLGFEDAASWSTERLVNLCGELMLVYRRKYKRLNKKEWYAEIAAALAKDRIIYNAFGSSRLFMGNPADNGTQREATAFIGQSDTADNMNRVMDEIDWGIIPENFRDGPNPSFGEIPRRMTYESHGFAFLIQVHDNFVATLNLRHPKWKEAANNLLHVMERPIIIHGRKMRVRAEAEVGLRWGGKMHGWSGDSDELDLLVDKLKLEGLKI